MWSSSVGAFGEVVSFHDTFAGGVDPSALAAVGWSFVWDSNNPAAAVTNFYTNDAQCVIKVTAQSDGVSGFTDEYVYVEHDIAESGGETTVSGNLYGQDAGDILLTTEKPARLRYASLININGARFRIRYQGGLGVGPGPSFMFAVILSNGLRYAMSDWISTPAGGPFTKTTDPVEATVTEWRTILNAGSAPGQRLRLADSPNFLSSNALATIKAVGVYVAPGATPSRFDDFELLDYGVSPDYSGLRITQISPSSNGMQITWTAQGGRSYQSQTAPDVMATYSNVGAAILAGGFTGTVLSREETNVSASSVFRVELLPLP